jgi:hypothetical protein
MLARIFLGPRRNLRGKQTHNQTIFIRRPDRAVATQKCCSRAFLTTEADRAVDESFHEPLEAHRNFDKLPAKFLHHPIDHAAADQRLPHGRIRRPLRAIGEQITDGNGQVVVGIHQPRGGRDDPVPVRVRVIRESDLISVLERYQAGHRIRARAVHPDLAVVIDRHEREGRVDHRVYDDDIQTID